MCPPRGPYGTAFASFFFFSSFLFFCTPSVAADSYIPRAPPGDITVRTSVECPDTCDAAREICREEFSSREAGLTGAIGVLCDIPDPDLEDAFVLNFTCTCNEYATDTPTYIFNPDSSVCELKENTAFPLSPPYNPNGMVCTKQTAVCPRASDECSAGVERFCTAQGGREGSATCTAERINCWLCVGGNYTVYVAEDSAECVAPLYVQNSFCSGSACSENGCCLENSCDCHGSAPFGYWGGQRCEQCAPLWSGDDCKKALLSLTGLLGGEPTAAPAIIPFMIILMIYVLFAVIRKRWSHEQAPPRSAITQEQAKYFNDTTDQKLCALKENPVTIPQRSAHSRGVKNKMKILAT